MYTMESDTEDIRTLDQETSIPGSATSSNNQQEDRPEEEEDAEDGDGETKKICCQTCRRRGCVGWCLKFFWEGQMHNKTQAEAVKKITDDVPLRKRILVTHRRLIGLAIPTLVAEFVWWCIFIKNDLWYLFKTKYPMTVTMIIGSTIAGMTSEGGGAVAFPVMTLILNIHPTVARDFSLMVQTTGMGCATFSILYMRIQIAWPAIILCLIGGIPGMVFGFHVVDNALSNAQKKMYFVSIWFSFAFALFLLNQNYKRPTFRTVPRLNVWKAVVLVVTGFVGGIISSFSGNGLDVCTFSVLTLLFRVSEKVATPTSVVLMALASAFALFWRSVVMDVGPSQMAWEYIGVCAPITVVAAPLGAVLGSHFHRLVLASWVYGSDTVALVGAFIVVKQTPALIGVSLTLIAVGFAFFLAITYAGRKILEDIMEESETSAYCRDPLVATVSEQDGEATGQTTNKTSDSGPCNGKMNEVSSPKADLETVRLDTMV